MQRKPKVLLKRGGRSDPPRKRPSLSPRDLPSRPHGGNAPRALPSPPPRRPKTATHQPRPAEQRVEAMPSHVSKSSRPAPPPDLPGFDEPRDLEDRLRREPVRNVDPKGYPLLYHTVPVTRRGLITMRRMLRAVPGDDGRVPDVSAHFKTEVRLARNLYLRLAALPPAERRNALVAYLKDAYNFPAVDDEEIYGNCVRSVRLAKELVADFVEDFVPESHQAPFTPDGMADTIDDPVELLFACAENRVIVDSPIAWTRSFEMRRALVLGQAFMEVDLGLAHEDRVARVERDLTERLEQRFFEPGLDCVVRVRAALDGKTLVARRVLGHEEAVPPGCVERAFTFIVRYFRHRGRAFPVFFKPDQKRLPAVLLKMLAAYMRDPNVLTDLNRFIMVCRTRYELGACIQRLQETVFTVVGSTRYYASNHRTRGTADLSNTASSVEHRMDSVNHWLHGHQIEGQYQTLGNYLNTLESRTPVNHRRYKERALRSARKLLLPTEIYGVDWEDAEVKQRIDEMH